MMTLLKSSSDSEVNKKRVIKEIMFWVKNNGIWLAKVIGSRQPAENKDIRICLRKMQMLKLKGVREII